MSDRVISNLLHELNKMIFCEPWLAKYLFYSTSAMNLIWYDHEFNIHFITYPKKSHKIDKFIYIFAIFFPI